MDSQLSNNSNLMPKWFLHTEQRSSGIDVTSVRMRIKIIITALANIWDPFV